jgi:hypothetical protein
LQAIPYLVVDGRRFCFGTKEDRKVTWTKRDPPRGFPLAADSRNTVQHLCKNKGIALEGKRLWVIKIRSAMFYDEALSSLTEKRCDFGGKKQGVGGSLLNT